MSAKQEATKEKLSQFGQWEKDNGIIWGRFQGDRSQPGHALTARIFKNGSYWVDYAAENGGCVTTKKFAR